MFGGEYDETVMTPLSQIGDTPFWKLAVANIVSLILGAFSLLLLEFFFFSDGKPGRDGIDLIIFVSLSVYLSANYLLFRIFKGR